MGGNSISGNFRWVIYYLKKIIKGFLKLLKYISLLLAVLILQHVKIPDNFRFIEKYVDRINYGREFHPENDLLVILFITILLILFLRPQLSTYFSLKPFGKLNTYIWVFCFLLIIFLLEHSETGFKYIFQATIHPFYLYEYLVFILMLSIIGPIEEELVFRGPLLFLFKGKSKYVWLTISCVWFTLVHKDPVFAIAFSLGLSAITIRYNNLWIPIFAHGIWNFYVLFLI